MDEEKFDDRVKKRFPLENGNSIVKLAVDKDVDDFDKAKLVKILPTNFGCYILSQSKCFMNDVLKQIGGFFNNIFYYTDTDSLYIRRKYWSELVDNGLVGETLGCGKNDYGNSGIFCHDPWPER